MGIISQNQEAFIRMINEGEAGGEGVGEEGGVGGLGAALGDAPALGDALDQPGVIQVSPADKEAIERLKALGFPEHLVVQAYFACEKNESCRKFPPLAKFRRLERCRSDQRDVL